MKLYYYNKAIKTLRSAVACRYRRDQKTAVRHIHGFSIYDQFLALLPRWSVSVRYDLEGHEWVFDRRFIIVPLCDLAWPPRCFTVEVTLPYHITGWAVAWTLLPGRIRMSSLSFLPLLFWWPYYTSWIGSVIHTIPLLYESPPDMEESLRREHWATVIHSDRQAPTLLYFHWISRVISMLPVSWRSCVLWSRIT